MILGKGCCRLHDCLPRSYHLVNISLKRNTRGNRWPPGPVIRQERQNAIHSKQLVVQYQQNDHLILSMFFSHVVHLSLPFVKRRILTALKADIQDFKISQWTLLPESGVRPKHMDSYSMIAIFTINSTLLVNYSNRWMIPVNNSTTAIIFRTTSWWKLPSLLMIPKDRFASKNGRIHFDEQMLSPREEI